jgi:hypothetical protein
MTVWLKKRAKNSKRLTVFSPCNVPNRWLSKPKSPLCRRARWHSWLDAWSQGLRCWLGRGRGLQWRGCPEELQHKIDSLEKMLWRSMWIFFQQMNFYGSVIKTRSMIIICVFISLSSGSLVFDARLRREKNMSCADNKQARYSQAAHTQ